MWERYLPSGVILNGKYRINAVIGAGGFGITYLGENVLINARVAIKEFYPVQFVKRDMTGRSNSVMVLSEQSMGGYADGLKRFAWEAQSIARINNLDGIVSVKDFFYENNTAYMVMEYIEGVTLKQYLENNRPDVNSLLEMFRPMLISLGKIHQMGILHRDISPDNIIITPDNRLVLIDFGAARIVNNNDDNSLSVILKAGYAPVEQYYRHGKQGPWTDVYALCATILFAISGSRPVDATTRMAGDDLPDMIRRLSIDGDTKKALAKGLEIDATRRFASMAELEGALYRDSRTPVIVKVLVAVIIMLLIAIAAIGGIIGWKAYLNKKDSACVEETITEITEEESTVAETEGETESETESVPEAEVMTEDELLAIFRAGSAEYVRASVYDDFDSDGSYELFLVASEHDYNAIYGEDSDVTEVSYDNPVYSEPYNIWYVSAEGAEIIDTYTSDEIFTSSMREFDELYFGNEKMIYLVEEKHTGDDAWRGNGSTGTHIYDLTEGKAEKIRSFEDAYIQVVNERPYFMVESDDNCLPRIIGSWNHDLPELAYPITYLDGEFGELASVKIDRSMLDEIENWKQTEAEIENTIRLSEVENVFWYGGDVTDITITDTFYNDNGLIYINYTVRVIPQDMYDVPEGELGPDGGYNWYGEAELTLSGKKITEHHVYGGSRQISGIEGLETFESDISNIWSN